MPKVPSGTKFIGISANVDTTERRSKLINSNSEAYTIDDITASVSTTNPTSGVIPVNENGVLIDSVISQFNGNVWLNANLRLPAGGFTGTQSITMGSGTILTYDGSIGDFLFGNFSFPFVKGNYFSSTLALSSNGSTPHLNINSAGNVGIGTTSPSEVLDVVGNIKALGYKSSDGSVGVTGTANASNTLTIKNGLIVGIS